MDGWMDGWMIDDFLPWFHQVLVDVTGSSGITGGDGVRQSPRQLNPTLYSIKIRSQMQHKQRK